MNYIEESQAAGRHIMPDLVRAFALIGIALVNVGVIAYPMMHGYLDGGLETPIDRGAFWAVNSFFLLKSYTLFSFMFGVGFAYQMGTAEKRGAGFGARYFRRILGLLAFGILHVALLFQGDILVMYAILGSILFLFRNSSAKTLIRVGIGVYAFQILLIAFFALMIYFGTQYAPEDMAKELAKMEEAVATSRTVFGNGTFVQSIALRFKEWSQVITFGMGMQGLGAFAFFAFGLAAVRSNIIAKPDAPIWARFRKFYLPIGVIGSAFAGWVLLSADNMFDPQMMVGMCLITLFAPFSTAGYLGWIAKWAAGPPSPLKYFMGRGGSATLTAYLMQGLLLSLIFNNYGLGLYTKIGAAACTVIALAVALFTIAFSSLWRKKFKRGPLEAILRNWTYLGKR